MIPRLLGKVESARETARWVVQWGKVLLYLSRYQKATESFAERLSAVSQVRAVQVNHSTLSWPQEVEVFVDREGDVWDYVEQLIEETSAAFNVEFFAHIFVGTPNFPEQCLYIRPTGEPESSVPFDSLS